MKRFYTLMVLTFIAGLIVNVMAQETWYTLKSGDWDDTNTWTLDPAGAIAIGSAVPADDDNVIILSGRTVTVPDGKGIYSSPSRILTLKCGTVTIQGQLDLRTSGGHSFTKLKGGGRLLMSADVYPLTGDDSDFLEIGDGEGTVVYYGDSFELLGSRTFGHMEVNMNIGQKLTLASDYVLEGDLLVKRGGLQINNTSATVRNLTVKGSVNIRTGSSLSVGAGSAIHALNLYGDFSNSGEVNLNNGSGQVVTSLLGATNTSFDMKGSTQLYRLVVDKGNNQTFKATLSATNDTYFQLLGANNQIDYTQKALCLKNGTLELAGGIKIPSLTEGGSDFTIPETACLWINGAEVTTTATTGDNKAVTLYGKLKIESGSFKTPALTNGLNYGSNGKNAVFEITGGEAYLTQIRPYNNAQRFTYIQSGGLVDFFANSQNDVSAVLHIGYYSAVQPSVLKSDFVFQMTGGEMVFEHANNGNGLVSGIRLEVNDANSNVSGGTVTVYEANGIDFDIYSTIPLYNLHIKENGSSNDVRATGWYGGTFDGYWSTDFQVLNDLTIDLGTTFNDNGHKIYIGGDLTIAGTYTQSGSLVFNGDRDGEIVNYTSATLTMPELIISKDKHPTSGQYYSMRLTGTQNIMIDGKVRINQGALDVMDYWPTFTDSLIVVDGDLTSSGNGGLELAGSTKQYIKGPFSKAVNFGRLKLNNGSGAKLLSSIDAETVDFVTDATFDLDIYNLTLSSVNYSSRGWATTSSRYFNTSGQASDGGLTLPIVLNKTYSDDLVQLFPMATASGYSPIGIYVKGAQSASGTITVVPVNSAHPTVKDGNKVTAYYWKINSQGLNALDGSDMRNKAYCPKAINNSFNALMVLNGFTWRKDGGNENNSTLNYNSGYSNSNFITGDFTVGNQSEFNNPRVLYSVKSGNWDDKNTWSATSHTGSTLNGNDKPGASDVCIIGGSGTSNHIVTVTANNADASQVYIKGVSETGISGTPPTLFVKHNTSGHDINIIDGNGKLVYENNSKSYSTYTTINGDHTALCNSSEAIVEFTSNEAGPRLLPSESSIPYYPNLIISGLSGTTQLPWNQDLKVNGDLNVNGVNFVMYGENNGEVEVMGDVVIDSGSITFPEAYNHHMTVYGDIILIDGTFTGNQSNKRLTLYGGIQLGNGTFNFTSTNVVFNGDNTVSVDRSGTGATNFYRVYINKPESESVTFNTAFSLSGPIDDALKSLVLQSGICHLNSPDITLTINSGNHHFNIPSSSTLIVDNGAEINVINSEYGINLDGALRIENGAHALINGGNGNTIQYTSSGKSSISVSNGGELVVGGQIRRSTSSSDGYLDFSLNNGTVSVGSKEAVEMSRGVFELIGGHFSLGDGDLITIADEVGESVPSLYLAPSTVSFGSGSGFEFTGNHVGGIYTEVPLNNIALNGESGLEVQPFNLPLTVNTLTIGANSVFNANNLDLRVLGDFFNYGSFVHTDATVYFEGSSQQGISGSTSFYNLTKDLSNADLVLAAGSNITVENNLMIEQGTLNTAANIFNVYGNVINDGITLSSSGSTGIVMNGTDVQQISGEGSFGVLTIDNPAGVVFPTQSSELTFTDRLQLENGVFDIGRGLLVFTENATIESTSGFSANNMIQTNLSFTDNGIEKYFPEVSSGTLTFTYPIGSLGKYTPVIFDISGKKAAAGSIRVKAANEPTVSIPLADRGNVLQYNWTLDANNISGFTATARMYSVDGDALIAGVPMDGSEAAKYITARILLQSTLWNKFSVDDFVYNAGGMDVSTFYFSTTDDMGVDGDYTAGLNSAIPDQVPAFITVVDGDYGNKMTWAPYDVANDITGTAGQDVPDGGPRGSIIYVDHLLSFTENGEEAYRTYIDQPGVVSIGSSFGHRLGDVFGTGTLRVESGDIPAGFYKHFFGAEGGTLEYSGTNTSYDVLGGMPNVNNLILSGSGQRRMPDIDVQLYGNFTIDGATVENTHNANLSLQGDLIFASGTLYAGTSESTLIFNGTAPQQITGATNFTLADGGALHRLEIDNPAGLAITNEVEIADELELTLGVIHTESGSLTITNTSSASVLGGSSASHVQGSLKKLINANGNFNFPLGDNGRYGQVEVSPDGTSGGIWTARYHNYNPGDDGYDPESLTDLIKYVSHNEYWTVKAPPAGTAQLTLRWDNASGVNPAETGFSAAQWLPGATPAWDKVALGTKTGDINGGAASLASVMTFNANANGNFITFAATHIPAYTWKGNVGSDWFNPANWSGNIVPSSSSNITIANAGTLPVILGTTVAQAYDVAIDGGASLTIGQGARMTVNGDITMGGDNSLIIQNAYNNPASFINKGTVDKKVQMEWSYPKLQYLYLAHAVDGATVGNYGTPGTDSYVYSFPDSWSTSIKTSGTPLYGELTGYSAILANDATITTSGLLYTGVQNAVLENRWNLLGNTFASYLDLTQTDAWDFGKGQQTIWYTKMNGGEATYIAVNMAEGVFLNGADAVMPPGQAFWVRSYEASTISLNPEARFHGSGGLKSGKTESPDVLKLKIANANGSDEMAIVFRSSGHEAPANNDSEKFKAAGDRIPFVYSLKGSKNMAINVLPELNGSRTVELGYNVGKRAIGNIELTAANIATFLPGVNVSLEDKSNGMIYDLRQNPSVVFASDATTNKSRFVLHFSNISTDVEQPETVGGDQVRIVLLPQSMLKVSCDWDDYGKEITIFSIDGRLMFKDAMFGHAYSRQLNLKPGLYIVNLSAGSKRYQEKVNTSR